MRSFFSLLLLCCLALESPAGPIFRRLRGPSCWPSVAPNARPLTPCLRASGPSADSRPAECLAQEPSFELPPAILPSPQQDIVLEPRPGTGSPSRPGITTPKAPESLLPNKVTIDHGPEVRKISESLSCMAGKADTWLPWLFGALTILAGSTSLPWVARAAAGLRSLIQAALVPPPAQPPGQPASASPDNPVAASSTATPAT